MNRKQDPNDFRCFDHSAILGEHPGVYIIVYEQQPLNFYGEKRSGICTN